MADPKSGGARKKGMVNVRFGKTGKAVPMSEKRVKAAKQTGRRLYEDGSVSKPVGRRAGTRGRLVK